MGNTPVYGMAHAANPSIAFIILFYLFCVRQLQLFLLMQPELAQLVV